MERLSAADSANGPLVLVMWRGWTRRMKSVEPVYYNIKDVASALNRADFLTTALARENISMRQ